LYLPQTASASTAPNSGTKYAKAENQPMVSRDWVSVMKSGSPRLVSRYCVRKTGRMAFMP
jgi:hypothetical protein